MDGTCYAEVDGSCCDEWQEYAPDVRVRAAELARRTLRTLTAGRVGNCPVELRPCVESPCGTCTGYYAGGILNPRVVDGRWTNVSCNPQGCSCDPLSEVVLPGEAHGIEVWVDGEQFDAWKQYGNRLVRTDGMAWPSCQDYTVDGRKPGAFSVRYTPGEDPGQAGAWAYSTLACEYAKACCGKKCRLPSSVTSISRQGVTMELASGLFDQGLTGIREVDVYIASVNPNRLKVPSRVWSPDIPAGRFAR
jgi:hypothetical protein